MLLCTQMINGFNTDVKHDGRVYHVQTEDRHGKNPALESLVYIGGTIIAKKSTSYADKLSQGASEEMIASLLKRQHQEFARLSPSLGSRSPQVEAMQPCQCQIVGR